MMIWDVRIERKCENFCPKPDNIGRKSGFFYAKLKKKNKKNEIFLDYQYCLKSTQIRAKISVKW